MTLLAWEDLLGEPTPYFVFDLDRVIKNFTTLAEAFGTKHIYYAVKANNQPTILSVLKDMGGRFEVGSMGEIALLRELGVPASDMIFSAPVKLDQDIGFAHVLGMDLYVFDSDTELEKLARFAPGTRVLVRIAVPSTGSMFPLNSKFGASLQDALPMLEKARTLGLIPYGIAFHVGSQCERKETWVEAMEIALRLWREARGLNLSMLNIGGGFPAPYNGTPVSIEAIARGVLDVFALFPQGTQLALEPGRIVVADAGVLVASVIGMAERDGKAWLYLDTGALHGLFEAVQSKRRLPYMVRAEKRVEDAKHYVLTGPTCDPDDTILEDVFLPEMDVRDRVAIFNAGAYSLVYATEFGGFLPPKAHFVLGARERVGTV